MNPQADRPDASAAAPADVAIRRPPPPPPLKRRTQPTVVDVIAAPQPNVLAILSLALSLFWLVGVGSIGAVVLGHMAKRQIAASDGRQTGASLATAGLIIGYVGVAIMLIYILVDVLATLSISH